ncbi:MAG: PQQ-dependent sugar dehydrogenase [Verrucomicrobia bacterium]|nr:PQQ-dependent sugar dehydrogenase [Verrucomicrobiota bacterium]
MRTVTAAVLAAWFTGVTVQAGLITTLADVNLTQRVANTTLSMPQTPPPDATVTYTLANAFPSVAFTAPMAVAVPPGATNRLFVAERSGIISVVTNLANPSRTVFMNISSRVNGGGEGGILALAFHPNYASNGYFYVWYTTGNYFDRLSRFTVSPTNANQAATNTEQVIIMQLDDASNHNGGDLHFGADGYLYLSLGDEGNSNDSLNNSQLIDKDFFAGLIRIDVDKKPGNLPPNPHAALNGVVTNYLVPADNPFVGATSFNGSAVSPSLVRTEFWAVGLRNPFRWSFDPPTGKLYLGDVGQNAREEVDLIVKGGNYGWKWREGRIATPGIGVPPAGFTNWINPVLDYTQGTSTNQGYTVVGGRVYRGTRFTELVGKYVFCDFGKYSGPLALGNMWAMTDDGTNATSLTWLLQDQDIAFIGADPRDGELLFCDLGENQIKRLAYATVSTNSLPLTLADTGAFADAATLMPYPGIVPYDLNVPFWSDGAIKTRWFSVPGTNTTIGFDPELPWTYPTGTVWVKHFELELTNGVPSSRRRIETRLLVKNSDGSGGYGATYRWGASTTNAFLVPAGGLAQDDVFVVKDGGTIRTQAWHYPSRAECLSCHQVNAGFALGFNTVQLNRDHDYNGAITNQIRALNACGYFSTNVTGFHLLRKLAGATEAGYSLEYRARSYLQANCGQCHFPGGLVSAAWDARIATALSDANIVTGALVSVLGDPTNRVVVPGDLRHSMLHTRMSIRGQRQMPPLASTVVDTQGVALIAAWIGTTLTNYQSFADWQVAHFGSTTNSDAAGGADLDGDGGLNQLEYLTGSDPTNPLVNDAWALDLHMTNGVAHVIYDRLANRGFDVQVTTNLVDGAWQSLDVPENIPFFSAVDGTARVPDPGATNQAASYYRVRVYEP